ncbi:MAG: DUF4445 domain-containing protein [Gemmatimonadota bacterium]|nr:MAG: DUF4445 domain-containing protein [Gemmatimonadota bacterium]
MVVHIRLESHELEVQPGQTLFDCADRLHLPITNSCGKKGTCRECLVEVAEGGDLLRPRTEEERHLRGDFRLACRARIRGQSGTIRFRRLRWSGVQIVDSGAELPETSRRFDPAVTRDGAEVRLEGTPIAETSGPIYGLAVDLGTTTVVVRLVDLESAHIVASQSFENPQRFAGSDVMARIAYTADDQESRLRLTLAAYINEAVAYFDCQSTDIYEICLVGNPTMRDILFGMDVRPLGQSPYRSITEHEYRARERTTTGLSLPARQLGLQLHPHARAYSLPLIGSHVGADAAACLLAVGALDEDRLIAIVDIGTNTELLVGNRRRMLAASCPAGPAFEGGAIACGMPAFAGAIEGVQLRDGEAPTLRVIGGGPAVGVCGSGLVDVLAELRRTGKMSELGRLAGGRFAIDAVNNIYLSESDISTIAQAKAAQVAGWVLLMRRYGAVYEAIERLYLAGGFASRIAIDAALRIGLIPPVDRAKVHSVGNAAIEGATLALCSRPLRLQLESFVKTIEHVELETEEGFFDAFVEGCRFKPIAQQSRGSDVDNPTIIERA